MALCGTVGTVAVQQQTLWGETTVDAPKSGAYPRWVRVELVRESRAGEYRAGPIGDPEDAARIIEPLLRREPREVFLAALLDTKRRVNAVHRVSIGGIDHCPAAPREVFQVALLANAASIIIAHNHPSGDPQPSQPDVRLTERLIDAGRLLGVPVLDRLVIGDARWVSLRRHNADLWQAGDE